MPFSSRPLFSQNVSWKPNIWPLEEYVIVVDTNWIIIQFFIYICILWVEKMRGICLQGNFSSKFQYGKLGWRTFQSPFVALNNNFWGYRVWNFFTHSRWCSKHWYLSNDVEITLIRAHKKKLCLPQVDLPSWPPWYEWMPHHPPLINLMGLDTCGLSRKFYKVYILSLIKGW